MTRNCPVCEEIDRLILLITPLGQNINCCSACGMVYADNTPLVDYSADSVYTHPDTYAVCPEHFQSITRILLENGIFATSPILDVGCAQGGMMKTLIGKGFTQVRGLSISKGEVDACVAQGLDARHEEIAATSPASTTILSHVLEHISDVMGFLSDLKNATLDYAYIEVPDATRYSEFFKSLSQGFNTEHINHFSPSHLALAVLNAGMTIHASGRYTTPLTDGQIYPVIWVLARPHSTLKDSINRYAEKFSTQFKTIRAGLLDLPPVVAVWGAGQTAQLLLSSQALPPSKVRYSTDTNPAWHGKRLGKSIVVPPEEFRPPADIPIIVCAQISQSAILSRIYELNLPNQIITLER